MRFMRYMLEGRLGLAVAGHAEQRAFHGLTEDQPGWPGDLPDLLSRGEDLAAVGHSLEKCPDVDISRVKVLPPIAAPGKIVCAGLNYLSHARELGIAPPAYPAVFARFASSLIGHGFPIIKPGQYNSLDYEGELAVIIGRAGRAIPLEKSLEHVAGYAAFNDVTVREVTSRSSQWLLAKNFDGTGAFGPCLSTADGLPPGGQGLRLTTKVNGTVMQDGNTSDMIFNVAVLISLISEGLTLEPGDVILTGTPPGVGAARNPPAFLQPGDICEVEIEGIGILHNPVATV
jgi:2-keto-4-pentenoate hydratase/2-oxohepta-3-ene-1,7-dioic acid hydratase in catechol pathway